MIKCSRLYSFILLTVFVTITTMFYGCSGTSTALAFIPTLTSIPTLASAPTVSLLPTITPIVQPEEMIAQQQTRILELMVADPDCTLPCWWGIRPGKTTWLEANDFLRTFATKIVYEANEDSFSAAAFFNTPPKEISSSYLLLSFSGEQEIIQTIKVTGIEGAQELFLSELLDKYGQPGEVWINTFSSYIDDKPPFTVFLFYPQLGILAQYDTNALIENTKIHACANQVSVIRLWSPDRELSFEDALQTFDVNFDGITLPSFDALDMNQEEFYRKYSNSENPCFETSKMKWPGVNGSTPVP